MTPQNAGASLPSPRVAAARAVASLAAVALPILWSKSLPPSATHLNEMLSVAGWGVLMCVFPAAASLRASLRAAWPVAAALAVCALACAWTLVHDAPSTDPWLPALAMMGFGIGVLLHGAAAGLGDPARHFRAFAVALLVAGVGSALVGIVQVFFPAWANGPLLAPTAWPNRASGNVGQPNHLADIQAWALAAAVTLLPRRRDGWRAAAVQLALAASALIMAVGIVATNSRTGLLGVGLLALWGLFDRRLAPRARIALLVLPLAVAGAWLGEWRWARAHGVPFTLVDRVSNDPSSFRFNIWHDALQLIAQNPWTGVGWGNFNFAWTLSPFGFRPEGPTDNAHDLALQLAVELGVPCAAFVLALLLAALWRGFRRARKLAGADAAATGCALVMVLQIGMHSLLEYPLWYVYLLYPAAWAWGLLLGAGARAEPEAVAADEAARRARAWRMWGVLMVTSGLFAYVDYLTVVSLFQPPTKEAAREPAQALPELIVRGQASLLFGTKADFVLATLAPDPSAAMPEIRRAAHALLSPPVLFAWANALARQGQVDKARYLAERLHEYPIPDGQRFFGVCAEPQVASAPSKPYQCTPSSGHLTWRDFR